MQYLWINISVIFDFIFIFILYSVKNNHRNMRFETFTEFRYVLYTFKIEF